MLIVLVFDSFAFILAVFAFFMFVMRLLRAGSRTVPFGLPAGGQHKEASENQCQQFMRVHGLCSFEFIDRSQLALHL